MSFDRTKLPDPLDYYQNAAGLTLKGKGEWRTTGCPFHGSKSTFRINVRSGSFKCMSECGASGGDVLAFHRAANRMDFVAAAKDLNCYVADSITSLKPTPFSARDGLSLLAQETNFVAVCLTNFLNGVELTEVDKSRLLVAAGRINLVRGAFQ
jgi:hypothetical protein